MHLTIGVLGDNELSRRLGKKGTTNDIEISNHGSSEGVFTYVCPNSDKIQTLLQVLNMIDVPVLVVNKLTKEIGEMIVGLDEMDFDKGFIITSIKEQLQPIIEATSLRKYEIIDESSLRPALVNFKVERKDDYLIIPIDNYFKVTGVGTIILGIVKSGMIKKFDKVLMEPLGKEVLIKGIQSQDNDLDEAEARMRVGLNLKGVEVEEIKRGFVLCKEISKASTFNVRFTKNKFSKQELKEGMNVLFSVGLQVVTCTIESMGDVIKLKSNQPVAYVKNQHCMIASQNDDYPRIIGSGHIE
ncbi:MAG: EF-Tu/IF-2/RF-3 family GTPase [Candidatus Aenigmatarchaeota archaeon]